MIFVVDRISWVAVDEVAWVVVDGMVLNLEVAC